MRVYLSASQDTTIYQRYPDNNAGLDEIIEVGKIKKQLDADGMYASASARAIVQFDLSNISSYPSGASYFLNLYLANATEVSRYQKLQVYPVSRSWIEGSGYFYQNIKNVQDGATWKYANTTERWVASGSDYVTTPSASYTFSSVPISDVKIDVTNIISQIRNGTNQFTWNGLLIKFPDADETSSIVNGNLKFFSSNTHTIFSPKLEIVWNSQNFNTGSLKPIPPNGNVSIVPKNLKEAYTKGEVDKIYFVVRDPYPDKRFDATQRYKNVYYLPSQSYYRVTDTVADIKLYDFDSYSAVNCDASGSYIILDTSGLEVERYYDVELKITTGSLVFFPEFKYTFKIDNDG